MTITDTLSAETAGLTADSACRHHTVQRTVVFTDLVGSTAIAATQGDEALLRILTRHDRIVSLNASAWGGTIVKSTGDGAMIVYERATLAVSSAIHIQRQALYVQLAVKVGIDHGRVVEHDSDYHGLIVNVASRLADSAVRGEILLTERAARAASLPGPTRARRLSGLDTRIRVRSLIVTQGEN